MSGLNKMLRTPKSAKVSVLNEATSRKFDGGLNVADSQLNLTSKYAVVLDNMLNGIDGSLQVRQGTKLFADMHSISSYTNVNMEYFYGYLIVINSAGELFAIDGQGTIVRIWDSEIAANKRPDLTTWGSTDFAVFTEFGGALIVGNGIDKPLIITTGLDVDYLADLATGSNINVPIGRLMEKFSLHLCIANGSMLYVSERSAAGTWEGDSGAQFVNTFDMKTYVIKGNTDIVALSTFKGYLFVWFRECIVPVQFVEDATATPKLALSVASESVILNYGSISSRVVQDVGEATMSTDIVGCSSIGLSKFTKILSPNRPSRLVDKILQKNINNIDVETLENHAFSIYDRRLSAYQLCLPDASGSLQTATPTYVYRNIPDLNLESWSVWRGWNWQMVARSSEGNIFYGRRNCYCIFIRGDEQTNPLHADFIGEQEMFSDDTDFTDCTGWSPVADEYNSGIPITWAWELPWADLKHRAMTKTLRYVILDTEGGSEITFKVFIDEKYVLNSPGEAFSDGTFYTDNFGNIPAASIPYTPALTTTFVAKDHGGYGVEGYGSDLYGSGNNTANHKLTLMPTKFNTMKLRFEGRTTRPLKFVAITLLYQGGTIRRLPL
jgi:hypothetical protein